MQIISTNENIAGESVTTMYAWYVALDTVQTSNAMNQFNAY